MVPVLAFVIPPDGFDEERFSTEVRLESYANKGALDDSCRGTYSPIDWRPSDLGL